MADNPNHHLPIKKVAILVDGGFYRWRAHSLFGDKSPKERAEELFTYCLDHTHSKNEICDLYRIFYYDCYPAEGNVFNPISGKAFNLKQSPLYNWSTEFLDQLKQKRKMALRLGKLSLRSPYVLDYERIKALANRTLSWEQLRPEDLTMNIEQKGVDMRIGVDIASMAFKRQVEQIVLISGDSDFVPAAKLARREGIDFILDPMGAHIAEDLFEHIDGLRTKIKRFLPTPSSS